MSTAGIAPDFADRTDFVDADRGLVSGPASTKITAEDGRVAWDFEATAFLREECPATADPSLWRQSQLCARAGLYEVTEGVYQIRGFDLSNMTLIEGERGVVVVDPLVSKECAAEGLPLYRAHRGDRPVTAVLFTHSHIDHFGGTLGVVGPEDDVPIVAPQGFMEHAVAENVYAGTAMLRRGVYHTGGELDPGPRGLIGVGLGFAASHGLPSLLPPTLQITRTVRAGRTCGVREPPGCRTVQSSGQDAGEDSPGRLDQRSSRPASAGPAQPLDQPTRGHPTRSRPGCPRRPARTSRSARLARRRSPGQSALRSGNADEAR